MPKYYANDKYSAELSQAYIPGSQVLYVTAVPKNVPTVVVAFHGTEKETVFAVTGKTISSLTGISRLRGANVELDMGTPLTCLNNEEFINQFVNLTGLNYKGEWNVATDYVIDDWVIHLGSAYFCFITPPNHEDPTNSSYWVQFSAKGDPGKEVELQTTATYIQWRYVGDETWNNLVELSVLKGDKGDTGIAVVDSNSLIETTLINDTTNTNSYAGNLTVAPTEYKIGMKINLKVTNANTGSSTLNLNSLGVKTIKKNVTENLVSGDIKAGQIVPLVYDGTNFQIVGGGGTGSAVGVGLVNAEIPSGTVNGSNTAFAISSTPVTGSVKIYQNGIRLKITEDYTISGKNITFNTAPATGDLILADYETEQTVLATGTTSFIDNEVPGGTVNGSNTAFTLAFTPVSGTVRLYRDGQLMNPGSGNDYTISGANITFTTAPESGSVLLAFYQKEVSTSGNADTLDGIHATDSEIEGQLVTYYKGWIKLSESMTYASANTINIATGGASRFQKGNKLRIKQGAGWKYYYIIGVADTLLTVTGGTDFTVANAAITDIYVSREEMPFGFPMVFNCGNPTFNTTTIDNGTGGQQPTLRASYFEIHGNKITYTLQFNAAYKNGTGNQVTITAVPSQCPTPRNDFHFVKGITNPTGIVIWRYGQEFWLLYNSNVSDNVDMNYLSAEFSYYF